MAPPVPQAVMPPPPLNPCQSFEMCRIPGGGGGGLVLGGNPTLLQPPFTSNGHMGASIPQPQMQPQPPAMDDVIPFDNVPPCDDCLHRARYQGSYGSQCQGQPGTECALRSSQPNTPNHSNQSTMKRQKKGRRNSRSSISSNASQISTRLQQQQGGGGSERRMSNSSQIHLQHPCGIVQQVTTSDADADSSEVVETVESSV